MDTSGLAQSDLGEAVPQHSNLPTSISTAIPDPLVYIKRSIEESTVEIAGANSKVTKGWVSDRIDPKQSSINYDAFVFNYEDGTEIQQCQLVIDFNAYLSYLKLGIQALDESGNIVNVAIKIGAQCLQKIKAANISQTSRKLLPEGVRSGLEGAMSKKPFAQIKRRRALIEESGSSCDDKVPVLVDIQYSAAHAAPERIHVGTPQSAKGFTSQLKGNFVRLTIAGNSRTVQALDDFVNLCAYQNVHPPAKELEAYSNSLKSSRTPPESPLQKHVFEVSPSFHGLDHYKLVMALGAKLEFYYRLGMITRYTAKDHMLRLVEVMNTDKKAYYGFIPLPQEELRINPSTKVDIGFVNWEVGRPSDTWTVKVADAIPFGPEGTLPLLLTRKPIQEGRYQQVRDAPDGNIFNIRLSGECVKIAIRENERILDYKLTACSLLGKHTASTSKEIWSARIGKLLCGQNMAPVDMFGAIRSEFPHPEDMMNINPVQRQAVQAAQCAPGGFQFVQGPPGTGKTHYAIEFAKPFLRGKSHNSILVISQANKSVDTIAIGMQSMLQHLQDKNEADKRRFVVRSLTQTVELGIVRCSNPGKRSARLPLFGNSDTLQASAIANFIRERYLKQTSTKYEGIDDRRVQELELSVGWRMLQIAGVIPHLQITETGSTWSRFRALYARSVSSRHKLKDDDDSDKEDDVDKQLEEEARKLYKYTLSKASVVVATVSNASSRGLLSAIQGNVSLVILDEAGREREDNLLPLFVAEFPKNNGMLTIGDPEQLKPRVESPMSRNPFVEQLEISFLERMIRLGFELFTFTIQYRMVPEISIIPNTLTYDNLLEDAESVQLARRPIARAFRDFVSDIKDAASNVLFVDMQPCAMNITKTDHARSRYNELMIVSICDYLCLLLKRFKKVKIAVLTAYTAQSSRLEIAINNMVIAGVEGAENIHVGRFEGEQGEQYDIVLIDLLVAHDVGFLADKRRLNVAVSRARDGLIVFADSRCIRDAKGDSSYMRALLKLLKQYSVNSAIHHKFPPCACYQPEALFHQHALPAASGQTSIDQTLGRMALQ